MIIALFGFLGWALLLGYVGWIYFHVEKPIDAVAELRKSIPEIAIQPKQRFDGIEDDERYALIEILQKLFMDATSDLYKEDPRVIAAKVGNELVEYLFFDVRKGGNDK